MCWCWIGCCCRVLFLPKIKINRNFAILKIEMLYWKKNRITGRISGIRLQPDIRFGLFLQPDNPESGSGLKITIRYRPITNCFYLKNFPLVIFSISITFVFSSGFYSLKNQLARTSCGIVLKREWPTNKAILTVVLQFDTQRIIRL